ncbi:MAG: hypothetical protein ACQES5_07915 [Thermodesulfobacteriota bacterium]
MQKKKRTYWLLFSFFLLIILGLTRVWVNVERVDMSYELEKMREALEKNLDLRSKLIVERDNLLSSCNLQEIAREQGLKEPKTGQIRKPEGK